MTRTKVRAWRNEDEHTVKSINGKTFTFKKKKIPRFGYRFPTCRAANKYEVYTRERNLFMERGFMSSEFNQLELPDTITRVIKAHKWETFCQNPSPASIPLVREFYANYDPDEPDLVRVRGKLVDASASAVNSLYSLTDHQSSLFKAGSEVWPPVMRDIVKELTGKLVTTRKARYIDLSWRDLKGDQVIWMKFIQYSLLPTDHFKKISKDSATLLYCIMSGKPINVGKVIAEQIKKCHSLESGDLWFPSLITRLCKRHDVVSSCEPVEQPHPPLDDELVESESDQETIMSDHDTSVPVNSTSHPSSIHDSACQSALPSAPSAEPSSSPQCDSDEVTSPLPTTPATLSQTKSSQQVPPSARASEPSSPPQTDLDELPIGLKTSKRKERAWINTENQKKKQKTTRGSVSIGKSQPLERRSPFRFPTCDKQMQYERYTSKRNLLMERGFVCPKSNKLDRSPLVSEPIKSHKWESFCQHTSHASIPLVGEFYANYDAARPDLVYVRGKLVDASPSAINSIFSLTNHQTTLFDDVSKVSPLAMSDIVYELTGRRKVGVGNSYIPFSRRALKKGPKIWRSFTERNLFPSEGNFFVGKELAILLYCIMVGMPINVGKVIAEQIQICASLNYSDLWFPSLITRLCERHNVLPASREPIQQPYSSLPNFFVARTTIYKPVQSEHDQQTNPSNQQTSHTDPDPSFSVTNTGLQSPDKFGSGPNLPVPGEAAENAPTHFDSYQQCPPPTAQTTSSQPLPPVAPLTPPAKLSCLSQTDSDKLLIHVPGLPILAEAAEKSLPPTAQATSVLPAEPLSQPQTHTVVMQIGLRTSKRKKRAWINTVIQKKRQKTTQGSISTGKSQPLERIPPFRCRFPTVDKQKRYERYTSKRNLLMEIGFMFPKSNHLERSPIVSQPIISHKWEIFCQDPSHASIPLVREFYANYDAARPELVYVRGKLVDASPSAINSIYSLTNHQNTLFDDVSKVSLLAMNDIVYELTGRRKVGVGNSYIPFSRRNLKKGPEIWKSFSERNLFRGLDKLYVGKEMAILLYCIMVGKPINVGKVIAKQIQECASQKYGSLWFPALITRLCERHNVLPASHEPIQQPYSPLRTGFVARTTNYEPVESGHDQQTNPSIQQTSHLDPDPSFPIANTGLQSPDKFGSGSYLPDPREATENAPTHFESSQQSPPPNAHATSSQPLPPVAPLAPPADLSCLPRNKLPIHVPGLPILAEAAEKSLPPTSQATSSQPPVAPSVLPAELLSQPQTHSVVLQVSAPQCGTICVQGYNVKKSVAPMLEAILKKHGDIAAECLCETAYARSYFLEVVCKAVTQIETGDVTMKMEEIERHLSHAEAANINVSWLRAHLESVRKRKKAMKRPDLLMEMKVNISLVRRAAQMDLREICEELMTAQERFEKVDLRERYEELVAAQERFEKAERCARVLHLVEKNIKNTILETKTENDSLVRQPVL